MKKTYQGSCHCGAVAFECELDLAAGTNRCNCGFCRKARFWFALAKEADLRLLRGAEQLTDYQSTPVGKSEPFLHFTFCSRCGFRPFTRGGALPQLGGPFFAVNVACLDGVSDEELASIPVRVADGRNDDWNSPPAVVSYL
jgi:hypothetical protein